MICQVTLDDCKNNCAGKCHFLTGQASPPPPTLAEIERLVDAHGYAEACYLMNGGDQFRVGRNEAKAALMAAIRLYVQE